MIRSQLLLLVVCAPCAHSVRSEESAIVTARAWLAGVRTNDLGKIAGLAALPFALHTNDPLVKCETRATDTASLARLLRCFVTAEPDLRRELAFMDETTRFELAEQTADHAVVVASVTDQKNGVSFILALVIQSTRVTSVRLSVEHWID